MLFRGILGTAYSGKLDGLVAAHNSGGPYFRNFTVPTDPATERQVNCREAMAACYAWWRDNLSASDRQAWENYARANRITNRIGTELTLSGLDAFSRQAFLKFQLNEQLGHTMDPGTSPPIYGVPFAQAPWLELGGDNESVDLNWVSMDTWEGDQDNFIAVYTSTVRSQLINFFKGPYQLRASVNGDSEVPPVSPVNIPLGFTVASGERVFYRLRFCGNDRPLSMPYVGMIQRP